MRNISKSSIFLLVLTFFFSSNLLARNAGMDQLTLSKQAGKEWLALLDKGNYAESWEKASTQLQLRIPKDHWVSLMNHIRKSLGSVSQRELIDQRPSLNPVGLPEGNYMVLFYQTSFTQRPQAHELITLIQESDKTWRVLTYQVQ